MPRKLKTEEAHLWGHVTATVRPLPGRVTPKAKLPPSPVTLCSLR